MSVLAFAPIGFNPIAFAFEWTPPSELAGRRSELPAGMRAGRTEELAAGALDDRLTGLLGGEAAERAADLPGEELVLRATELVGGVGETAFAEGSRTAEIG